jgi:hypothetical protein
MTPWLVLTALTAALNLFIFIWIRGRWGRAALALALASVLGTIGGHALGDALGITLFDIGNFHILPASVLAQLAMVIVSLLAVLGPTRIEIEE